MTCLCEPDYLCDVWAKSANKGQGGEPETLATHTWHVLSRLADLIRLRPALPEQLGVPRLWHVLFWAAFLHDFGKAAKGFQARLRGKGAPRWPHRHEVLSLAFVDWVAGAFSKDEMQWLTAAIVSHHRDLSEIQLRYNTVGDPDDQTLKAIVAEVDDAIIVDLWRWINEFAARWIEALGLTGTGISLPNLPEQTQALAHVKQAGAKSIRKWLRTWQKWTEDVLSWSDDPVLLIGTIALRGHLISADHTASAHVGELPNPQLSDPDELIRKLRLTRLFTHQIDAMNTRGNVVLMAPTGSGKTEAALLWAVSQGRFNQRVPRLFYALPFQASMNSMERRFTIDEIDADGKVVREAPFKDQVGLEHSKSVLALYRKLSDDDTTPEQAAKAERQAKRYRDLARLHYYPVRILTPYQLLKAPYRLTGYETLLTDCLNATFVFDEIHAFEPERLAMILATMKHLRQHYGAHFFVMSATLPKLLRQRLTEALGEYVEIRASDETYTKFQRHRLHLHDGELLAPAVLDEIAEKARQGKSVLVCCNTVKRAQEARAQLEARLRQKVEMIHGRFNGEDRLEKEKAVRESTGSRSANRRAIVLVATQVVEVSLDIDLDMIYTDPAPLEALLQRFGRINRRRLIKPSAPVMVFREPSDGQRIYDERLVRASLDVLEQHDDETIDEARISDWLDEVYTDAVIAKEWNDEFEKAYVAFERDALSTLRAFQASPELEKTFYKAFDGLEVLPVGLEVEYYKRMDQKLVLEARHLFVTLRWGQYAMLANQGRVRESEDKRLRVVDAYYDQDIGLDLNRKANEASLTDDWLESI